MGSILRSARAVLALVAGLSCSRSPSDTVVHDPGSGEPSWHFIPQQQPVPEATFTGIWGNSAHELYVVGWNGVILTNRNKGMWEQMASPVTEHLTAIAGAENGARFGLPAHRGEMFAVGWYGTLLHYHPNPDDDPATEDGAWSIIAAPGATGLAPVLKPDPMCPDFDGDGTADDGNGDGWIGNANGVDAMCAGGNQTSCDDNCRTSANGPERPLRDGAGQTGQDVGCIGPGDAADPASAQVDGDGDGVGLVCDDDDLTAREAPRFSATLFGLWARAEGADVTVIAVGENGSLVTYRGPAASEPVVAPAFPITDARAWLAQEQLPFRYSNDTGRLPPSCPAQCNPIKTTCSCPVNAGQCCDPSAGTGAGCGDGSCGPAANACDGGSGVCSALCPDCFRRLDKTLRAVAVEGSTIVAVGARGTIVIGDRDHPTDVWRAPGCPVPPSPLDERPVLAGVRGHGGNFHAVGAAGAVLRSNADTSDCPVQPRLGAPQGFLSAVHATGGNSAIAVGDRGLFLIVDGGADPQVREQQNNIDANLLAIWRTVERLANGMDVERFWLVGADGVIVEASYY